ncbi:hypothetical protein HK102_006860 [Quaeritorhiza haematococci]|nr:hypothetical protein HK102_006860 [Quaeritorhiza haematococci]
MSVTTTAPATAATAATSTAASAITENDLRKAAQEYWDRGYLAFPLRIWGAGWKEEGKVKKGEDFSGATGWNLMTMGQVKALSFQGKNCVAVHTGVRNDITVIDVDNLAAWNDVLASAGQPQPETVRARSQSGGLHMYFNSVIPTHKLTVRGHLIDDMVNMLEKTKTDDFPQFQLSRRFVAFKDGVWDLETLQFHDMASDVPGDIVARHYIDEPFPHSDPETLETPEFDRMVLYELEDPEVYKVFLALMGRLEYPVGQLNGGQDNWQIMPFLLGRANTGKSSVLMIAQKMFNSEAVGAMAVGQEDVFGLEGLYTKEAVFVLDTPLNMRKCLPATKF